MYSFGRKNKMIANRAQTMANDFKATILQFSQSENLLLEQQQQPTRLQLLFRDGSRTAEHNAGSFPDLRDLNFPPLGHSSDCKSFHKSVKVLIYYNILEHNYAIL